MIFTEVRFIVLFLGCWGCFVLLPRSWRSGVLAFWGMAFYLVYAGPFLAVVLLLAVLTFFSGHRAMAWIAGVSTLGVLAYFKLTLAMPVIPGKVQMPAAILIPLGLSYLAFELLHVTIERRRGRIGEIAFLDLLAFVFFAPARAAGPIKRFPTFTLAVRDATMSGENVYAGCLRILLGFAKKFLLADFFGLVAAQVSQVHSMASAWEVMLAYALEIYFDFSAYSDIAIGFARILGIELPENFKRPYFAANIREFWDRWHITLSHWVRDYIFMPTGRALFKTRLRRSPFVIASVSYLLAFSAVGAWHGFTAGFMAWGLYHGILLSVYNVVHARLPMSIAATRWYRSRAVHGLSAAFTFICVTIGWVPFMLPLSKAGRMLAFMFGVTR
jgi:alginate O-acetyltransferase complex protein AlgI